MRADLIVLRLGANRDLLVGVQADSSTSLATLRTLFADWLDDTMVDELAELPPAFEVHLTSAATTRGRRTLPHLRYGREVLVRADHATPVLHALASVLGGIHERRPDDGRAWVHLRAFASGDQMVLTDIAHPHLVNDRQLLAAGVNEVIHWGLVVDGDALAVPAPLPARWEAVGIDPPDHSDNVRLCGLIAHDRSRLSTAALLAQLSTHSTSSHWFTMAADLTERAQVHAVSDRSGARTAVLALLGCESPT